VATQRLAGSRIRDRRLDRGLRQAAVAETVGISPSYLNLIEHNRRRIGGKLLADIARALDVDPTALTDGADAAMLDQMRNAAARMGANVELPQAEEMAGRYPGWAALVAEQSRRIDALQLQIQALNDRMAYDPQLAASLHEVISSVTAIRSSSSILVGPEKLDEDWQRRFHQNIHNDSLRLAASSEALITYLEAPKADLDQVSSAFEQVELYLAKQGHHFPVLEAGGDPVAVASKAGLGPAAASLLAQFARQYIQDAQLMPLKAFEAACLACHHDPAALAQKFQTPFASVLRRLATLPDHAAHPPIGLAVCDAAGALTFIKPVPGFSLPRTGDACPLWPVFSALSRPEQPVKLEVIMPGHSAARLLCYAIATTKQGPRFDVPPAVQSTMLVMPDPPETKADPLPLGVSCRICPRADCTSRREPAVAGV
jgi:transcriptional regulator with XRE-family HTH domain